MIKHFHAGMPVGEGQPEGAGRGGRFLFAAVGVVDQPGVGDAIGGCAIRLKDESHPAFAGSRLNFARSSRHAQIIES